MVYIGFCDEDTKQSIEKPLKKVCGLRVFDDSNGKLNLSLGDIGGQMLLVSNFTLCADTSHGKRPSFANAARPDTALPLYNKFVEEFSKHTPVKTGVFGADMEINLVNDGPVTIILTEEPENE